MKQIIKYIIAGATAFLAGLFLLYFLTNILGIWYLLSTSIAFSIIFLISFFLQKFWTFENKENGVIKKQMVLSLLVALINLVINIVLMYLFVDIFKIWYLLAQIFTTGFLAVFSFTAYKFLIFKH